jgi:hypothetical protein
MNRIIALGVATSVTALTVGVGVAVADTAFDSSKPPPLARWMTRPCQVTPSSAPRLHNCYWNDTMNVTDAGGHHITTGFWIRKMPDQPLVCYFFSPIETDNVDTCYATTVSDRQLLASLPN